MDPIHSVLKWISYNRFTAVAVGFIAVLIILPSCSLKATSPFTGEQASVGEVRFQYEAFKADLQAKMSDSENRVGVLMAEIDAEIRNQENLVELDTQADAKVERYNEDVAAKREQMQGLVLGAGDMLAGVPGIGAYVQGALPLGLGALTLLVGADNVRKGGRIKRQKEQIARTD